MLTLTRRNNQSILIKHNDTVITITVHEAFQGRVKVSIDAPREFVILREEVEDRTTKRRSHEVDADPSGSPGTA